ncbi:MAG: hypothetical protein Q4A15_13125 [Prevotellaceae bacterium]|nr:hypothetical protein [Prevotellaceae bacterium]
MKKILFLLVALLPMMCCAQDYYFKCQGKSFTMLTEDGKDFVVIDKPNKTAKELYIQTLSGVSSVFNSPKDVVSKIDDQEIAIFGMVDVGKGGFGQAMTAHVRFTFQFKDNKVRVSAPEVQKIYMTGNGSIDCSKQFKNNGGFNPEKKLYTTFHQSLQGVIDLCLKEQEDW